MSKRSVLTVDFLIDEPRHFDECSDIIEVEVKAYTRHIKRFAYTATCQCPDTPAILIAPPPRRVFPRSDFGSSFWVEVILNRYRYAQPSNRYPSDLNDQGCRYPPALWPVGLKS